MMSTLPPLIRLFFTLSVWMMGNTSIVAAADQHALHIRFKEEGVAVIHATIELPASPDIAFAVLTDYTNWPLLFPEGIEVQVKRLSKHMVITEMKLPHKVLPSKTRLKTKSTETPPRLLETKLLEGDYVQYDQVWRLSPIQEGKFTQAELNLTVQPKGWIVKLVPEFLYRWVIEGDLQEHFEKLKKTILVKNGKE